MGIYDEQIKLRKALDDDAVSAAFSSIADAVTGQNLSDAFKDNKDLVADAVGAILSYYNVSMTEIPAEIEYVDEQIDYLLRPHGIMRRDVKLSKGWYKDATGAMLAINSEKNSVVALIPALTGGYRFFDKESGTTRKINKSNAHMISEDAIAFYKPFPLRKITVTDLVKFCFSYINAWDIFCYLLLTLVVTAIGLIMPWLNNQLFGRVIDTRSYRMLLAISVFMICATISNLLINTASSLISTRITTRIDNAVEAAAMMRVITLRPDFFKKYGSGELSSYTASLNSLCNMLINAIAGAGVTSVFSLAYIFSILTYAKALVIPALLVIAASLAFSVFSMYAQLNLSKRQLKADAAEANMSYALISGISKIKLSGAENRAFARWAESYSKVAQIEYNPPMLIKVNSVISTSITLIGTLFMYYFAIVSKVQPADYYSFNVAYGMVSSAFAALLSLALTFSNIKPILDAVKPIMDSEPEVSENKEIITSLIGNIELDNVSFRYSESTPMVIDNLSLKIKKGQYIAIVGATGCGKSTLMRLLLGFEKPLKGNIYYDRKDIDRIDLRSLRSKIGVVMQNGKLFMGDIFANISLSAPYITLDDAWEAAEIAGIADDIRKMPMGMSTIVTEGQGGISGGQKQRLMIARAVASKPKILMLDEATSALDNITQKKVSDALDNLKCTRIVIAHRLSTIKQADRIIVLSGGKIVEDGSYDELMANDGFFKELMSRQMA